MFDEILNVYNGVPKQLKSDDSNNETHPFGYLHCICTVSYNVCIHIQLNDISSRQGL